MRAADAALRLETLHAHNWNASRAARALGITVSSLFWWLKHHGVERPAPRVGRPLSVQVRSTKFGLEKRCRGACGQWLPLECFAVNRVSGVFGRENACRACRAEVRQQKRASGEWRKR